jgi:hypothetical protein
MSENKFPKFVDEQSVFCFRCRLPITGPFQASGFAVGHGSVRGQCTGSRGCGMITYFDWEDDSLRATIDTQG